MSPGPKNETDGLFDVFESLKQYCQAFNRSVDVLETNKHYIQRKLSNEIKGNN